MIKVNNEIIEQNKFLDGTSAIKYNPIISSESNYHICWQFDNDSELIIVFYLVKHIRSAYPNVDIYLHMPYIPNARMDRIKNTEDVFTLKYFCEFINSLKFKQVYVKNPHSYVSLALINNVVCEDIQCDIYKICDEISSDDDSLVLFYPDEGAMKRYSEMFQIKYAFGMKKRDWDTGKILSLDIVGDVKDKRILIVDDICSKGGTFYYSAKALKNAGANDIYLYITHCENSIYYGEIFKSGLIERVYTTDSIFRPDEHRKENNRITILN